MHGMESAKEITFHPSPLFLCHLSLPPINYYLPLLSHHSLFTSPPLSTASSPPFSNTISYSLRNFNFPSHYPYFSSPHSALHFIFIRILPSFSTTYLSIVICHFYSQFCTVCLLSSFFNLYFHFFLFLFYSSFFFFRYIFF